MNSTLIHELVMAWQEARDRGTPTTVAELCQDHPELAVALHERLAQLGEHVEAVADYSGTLAMASSDTSRAGEPPAPPVSHVPSWLGGYRVERVLGQGGMGAVYLAYDERLGRSVAIKTMKPEIAAQLGAKDRFLREARAVAQVDHDNVIPSGRSARRQAFRLSPCRCCRASRWPAGCSAIGFRHWE